MAWLASGTLTRELRDGEIIVGGGADADWRIAAADLMPRHFVLTVHGLNAFVRPSSAKVVVVLNDRQLAGSSPLLNDGDVIAAGSGTFVYSDDVPTTAVAPAPRSGAAFLVNEEAGVAHPLINRSTAIGRDGSNAIVLREPSASRFHAEVRREAGGFALHSMGAAGTNVNGRPLETPCLLAEGDVLEIADARFRFARRALPGTVAASAADVRTDDDATRRPTILSGRSIVEPVTRPGAPFGRLKLAVGTAIVAALAAIGWLEFHR